MNQKDQIKLNLANKLIEIIAKYNINQVKMGIITDRSQSYISKLLIAESIPAADFLIKLADHVYGTESDEGIKLFAAAGYVPSDFCGNCAKNYLNFIRDIVRINELESPKGE